MPQRALIFANGSTNDGACVQQALEHAPHALIVAADGGARLAQHFGLVPHIVIGDMDSLTEAEQAQLAAGGVEMHRYPADKNETDLELALLWAVEQGVTYMRIVGALGRRIDQTFGNVYLLALPQLAGCDVRLVSGEQQIWLAQPGTHNISGQPGDTLSLIPVGGDVRHISTENLRYPLHDETLYFGPARGISNVLDAAQVTVSFGAGLLMVVHTMGRAE
jgi:thiamine pyrophosphokinase